MCRSVPQIATESTWHSTSSGPGRGTGTSSRTSCWFGAVSTTARIVRVPLATSHHSRGWIFGIGALRLRAGRRCAVYPRHVEVDEGRDAAHAPLAADPAPRKGAERHALASDFGKLAAQILEHAHIAACGAVVDVFEVTFGQRLLDRSAAHLFVFAHQVWPHPADPNVERVIHRRKVCAEPFDLLLVDQIVDHLGLWPRMAIEVHHVVARGLGPVVLIPTRVEHDDVAFANLFAGRHTVQHVVE